MSMNFFQTSNEINLDEIDEDQFFDGKQKIIPNDTVLSFEVKDCFFGMPEGKSLMSCLINVVITEGEFKGQIYRFNAKLWDMNTKNIDKAKSNLGVLDAQAGFPMGNNGFDMNTQNLNYHWAGIQFNDQTGEFDKVKPAARGKLKMGLLLSTTDFDGNTKYDADGKEVVDEINFIQGFAYDRSTMVQAGAKPQFEEQAEEQVQSQVQIQAQKQAQQTALEEEGEQPGF